MASAFLFSIFLTTLFCVVLSLPAHRTTSAQLRTRKMDTEENNNGMVLSNNNLGELNSVNSLDNVISFDAVVAPSLENSVRRFRRTKRQVIRGGRRKCPKNRKYFARKCITIESFRALMREQEEK